jgi:hypothetical protein
VSPLRASPPFTRVLCRAILGQAAVADTVANQMVKVLAAADVQRIYGIVGDSLNGFTDVLHRHGGIQWL